MVYSQNNNADFQLEKFKQFYSLIQNHYLDTVNNKKLIETAMSKALEILDPHSVYFPAKEAEKENESMRGNFEGIGIQYQIIKDTLNVVDVISGGPSEKVGVLMGDKLISINDSVWAGKTLNNDFYIGKLRGPKGTKVVLKMLRDGKEIEFTIIRDIIPMYSVDVAAMVDSTVGYIRLNRFAASTPMEIQMGMRQLLSKGMKNLILDLQYNGGGILNSAVALSDEFLENEQLVVYTEGLHYPKQSFAATGNGLFKEGKLIILVNEYSASASEIVSGAIQDWDRGMIIGRRTYGKGLVQRPFSLIDKSQLRLTTSEYFTPSGRFIQKPFDKGIKEYHNDLLYRSQAGLLTKQDTVRPPDSLMKYTLVNKRKVFGRGGIMPDIYVPIDTSERNDYYSAIFRKGLLNTMPFNYAVQNKEALLSKYPNVESFKANFTIDSKLIDDLVKNAEKEGIKKNEKELKISRSLLETIYSANIARNLYGSSAYYLMILGKDPVFNKAYEMIQVDFSKYKIRNK
jgi:carboxyl-terminal processing protease